MLIQTYSILSFRLRFRDSAFRALELSCRSEVFISSLFSFTEVSLSIRNLFNFYQAIRRNKGYGKLVKSIGLLNPEGAKMNQHLELDLEVKVNLARMSKLKIEEAGALLVMNDGTNNILEFLFRQMTQIHTLIVDSSHLFLPFRIKIGGRLVTTPCFTTSLKKLYIPMWEDNIRCLTARNVIWLLANCQFLKGESRRALSFSTCFVRHFRSLSSLLSRLTFFPVFPDSKKQV